MTRKTWTRNIEGLRASASGRRLAAEARVLKALEDMEVAGAVINFQSVAQRGSVSAGFLYGREHLRHRIEVHRARQMERREIDRTCQTRTDAGLLVLLAAKERRIREFEVEVAELRRRLALCRGQLYERL